MKKFSDYLTEAMTQLNELDVATLKKYTKRATLDRKRSTEDADFHRSQGRHERESGYKGTADYHDSVAKAHEKILRKRSKGLELADKRMKNKTTE